MEWKCNPFNTHTHRIDVFFLPRNTNVCSAIETTKWHNICAKARRICSKNPPAACFFGCVRHGLPSAGTLEALVLLRHSISAFLQPFFIFHPLSPHSLHPSGVLSNHLALANRPFFAEARTPPSLHHSAYIHIHGIHPTFGLK